MSKSLLPANRSSVPPVRWDPWREFTELQARLDQLMSGFFGTPSGDLLAGAGRWAPLADVTETDDAYVVEVDVPGIKGEDLTVEATDGELVVSGESMDKERTGMLRTRTRRTGRFEYRTSLPANADTDRITAELADGVLSVRVPKTEAAKPRRIEITSK